MFCVTFLGLAVFSAIAAAAENMNTLLAMRFFAGAFGVSPLTNAPAVMVDIFSVNGVLHEL